MPRCRDTGLSMFAINARVLEVGRVRFGVNPRGQSRLPDIQLGLSDHPAVTVNMLPTLSVPSRVKSLFVTQYITYLPPHASIQNSLSVFQKAGHYITGVYKEGLVGMMVVERQVLCAGIFFANVHILFIQDVTTHVLMVRNMSLSSAKFTNKHRPSPAFLSQGTLQFSSDSCVNLTFILFYLLSVYVIS